MPAGQLNFSYPFDVGVVVSCFVVCDVGCVRRPENAHQMSSFGNA